VEQGIVRDHRVVVRKLPDSGPEFQAITGRYMYRYVHTDTPNDVSAWIRIQVQLRLRLRFDDL
jgi:hypothetical protein